MEKTYNINIIEKETAELLRKNKEIKEIIEKFSKKFKVNLILDHSEKEFYKENTITIAGQVEQEKDNLLNSTIIIKFHFEYQEDEKSTQLIIINTEANAEIYINGNQLNYYEEIKWNYNLKTKEWEKATLIINSTF